MRYLHDKCLARCAKKSKKLESFLNTFLYFCLHKHIFIQRDGDRVKNVSQKQLPWVSFFPFVKECT